MNKLRIGMFAGIFGLIGTAAIVLTFAAAGTVQLSNTSIDENIPAGSIVGQLSTTESGSGAGPHPHPLNYAVVCGTFSPSVHLPNNNMRENHAYWWQQQNHPSGNFEDPPSDYFSAGEVNNNNRNGTYSYGRAGGLYMGSIVEAVRTTGDKAILDELLYWSQQWRNNGLADWDNRGYEYFRYMWPNKNNPTKHMHGDHVLLDEEMMAGYISLVAEVFHQNRDCAPEYAQEADFWFTYLDENWVPKWLYRSTTRHSNPYVPPAELGLQNAINWRNPINPQNGRGQALSANPEFYDWNSGSWKPAGIGNLEHQHPSRHYGHSYIMGMHMYKALADYFADTGKTPKGTRNQNVNDYVQEAQTRHDYWYARYSKVLADGRRVWYMSPRPQDHMRADTYSQQVNTFIRALHTKQFGQFANENVMEGYANTWYNGTGKPAVFRRNNVNAMALWNDNLSGTAGFKTTQGAYLGCWDETGEIMHLNDRAIEAGPSIALNQNIGGPSKIGRHHGSHFAARLSCEQKRLFDNGQLNTGGGGTSPGQHTYTLVSGQGDDDNSSFTIDGSNLRIAESPDFETKPSYTIRIRTTNQQNETSERAFQISVRDIDESGNQNPYPSITGTCDVQFNVLEFGGGNEATYNPSFGPDKLNDGDGSDNSRFSRQGTNVYIDLDLGAQYDIGGLRVDYAFGDSRVSTFEVLTSPVQVTENNGEYEYVGNNNGGRYVTSGNSTNFEDYGMDPVRGRYVRINGLGNSVNDWNSISEIEVCGVAVDGSTPGDINGDGEVGIVDLSILLNNWESTSSTETDLNNDGVVNIVDLSILLNNWGPISN